MPEIQNRSAWGRARFGGGPATLILVSLLGGALIAILASFLVATTRYPDTLATAWLVFGAAFFPVMAGVFWAVLVDRSTLRGAPKDPESSIEATWYSRAASGAFTDMIALLGVGLFVFTVFIDLQMSVDNLLLIAILVAMLDFGIRYVAIKIREG